MSAQALIQDLAEKGVRLSVVDGGKLRVQAPKGALTKELKKALAQHKQGVIDTLLAARAAKRPPLSFSQQRLWFLEQLEGASALYNIPAALRIEGALDIEVLRRVCEEVVRRHEVLRTSFITKDGTAHQEVQPPRNWLLPLVDLSEYVAKTRETKAMQQAMAEATSAFELAHGPLLRTTLIRLEEESHLLLLTMHHIVSDGWSSGVLVREVGLLYPAFKAGEASPLPALSIQYADFASWQRQWLQGEALEQQLSYWRKQLVGTPILELPTDRVRPPEQSYRGAHLRFALSPAQAKGLQRLGQTQGTTLFMVLLAAFKVLLFRYTGQEDLCVGTPVANRNRAELEPLIGFFVNTLALRTDLSEDPSFIDLLARVRETTLNAYAHQDTPFERLVDALGIERDMSHPPLFQVMFVLQNLPSQVLELPGLKISTMPLDLPTSKFDLLLELNEDESGLHGGFEYSTDLFDEATITAMVAHFQVLLNGILADPSQRLSQLPLLLADERKKLVVDWNDTGVAYPQQDALLHELFERYVDQNPETRALTFEGRAISYQELEERANRLAHLLRAKGVGPDSLVAVYCLRSMEMVVALYGILKAGGAYLPLDPGLPQDRLDFILDDAQVQIVLSHRLVADQLTAQAEVLVLDSLAEELAAQPADRLARVSNPDHLAYVIYTSGSTGKPKGVLALHRGIVNRLLWMQATYPLRADDRILQKTPYGFDVSVWEFFWPLFTGAGLVIARPEGHKDPAYLVDIIRQEKITTLHFVPSMLGIFLEDEGVGECHSLRRVICSGEALPLEYTRRFFKLLSAELHNLYGPTEAAVDVSYWACVPESPYSSVPIGRPVANTQLYILDKALNPVPRGVVGELHIGGVQLARGYMNRPELTAKTFIPDVFQGGAARLYKTGDLARFLLDGNIEYMGRIDFQVKVRGFRIELGEIETVLGALPEIKETVVTARQDKTGEKRLVAYVVPNEGSSPTVSALRKTLAASLAEYMIPSAFLFLDALPLSPNGKVDRKALPAPEADQLALSHAYVAPRNAVEATLAEVWAGVLGQKRVGVYDNFFELGGDSILSIQMISRLSRAGLQLTPKQVFENQTIAGLAPLADDGPMVLSEQGLVAGDVPVTPIQHWFFGLLLDERQHWNQSVLLRPREALLSKTLNAAFSALVRQHDVLRLRYRKKAGVWQQSHAEFKTPKLQTVDLSSKPDPQTALVADVARVQASLSLSKGPLIQMVLYDLGGEEQRLALVLHHLVVDGVSWRILLEDLQVAYRQQQQSGEIQLPPKTTSFKQWAEGLQQYAGSEVLQAQSEYWAHPARCEFGRLAVDHVQGGNTVEAVQKVEVSLSQEETQVLLQEAGQAYRTEINDLLLAALAQVLVRWTDQSCVRIDLEGHGREELPEQTFDLSRTLGWFTTLYPVVLDLEGLTATSDLLKSIKEQLRALPQRGLGYGVLRFMGEQGAELEAALSSTAQIVFNYLGQFDALQDKHALFEAASEATSSDRAPSDERPYLLEVNASVHAGCLQVVWHYGGEQYDAASIQSLARNYILALRRILSHCLQPEAGGYTPSDFPLAGLDQSSLDRLVGAKQGIEALYPLAPLQEGMLFHALYDESQAYFQQLGCEITGQVDADIFELAWRLVIERHPCLRTSFHWQGLDRPLQWVEKGVDFRLAREDWRDTAEDALEARWQDFLQAERAQGFALDNALLMRMAWIELGAGRQRFVWSHHHIILDGWSLPIVLGEVFRAYEAIHNGEQPQLGPARPYQSFVAWLEGRDRADTELFWREYLLGFDTPTPLPLSARTTELSGHHELALVLSVTLSDALQALARSQRITLNTLVQAAWGLLLSRYSGEAEVVFGTTVAGRPADLPGVEEIVGLFINTVPLRLKITAGQSIAAWLQGLQQNQAELRQYEATPLAEIQRYSELPQGESLFDSLLVFENYPVDEALKEQGLSFEIGRMEVFEQTNFPLAIAAMPGKQLTLRLIYDRALFAQDTLTAMRSHLEVLLKGMVKDPNAQVVELPILTVAERHQLLTEWNQTEADFPRGQALHEIFTGWAAQTPDATALVCLDRQLSYRELNIAANRLAHYLRGWEVQRDDRVGICMERCPEMIVALLGVLKAGGAYVPLDPTYPKERLQYMLEDAGIHILLTQSHLLESLPQKGLNCICLDQGDCWEKVARMESSPLAVESSPEDLAYVIYTSGSTGKPKGVCCQHTGVLNLLADFQRLAPLDDGMAGSFWTSLSFDVSVYEVFVPLMSGGALHIVPEQLRIDSSALCEWLMESDIHSAYLPPFLLQDYSDWLDRHPGTSRLRRLLVGVEPIPESLLASFMQRVPGLQVINGYGPTEATVCCTLYPVNKDHAPEQRTPIGKAVRNSQLYVLDAHQQPLPIGVAGELYVGGLGLARHYLDRPELTAEAFIANPFSDNAGDRIYKTGDRVRYRADGNLEFQGRADHQVKLRGYRIELGEIESVLGQHDGVRETVVMVREDEPGRKRLVAYIVPEEAAPDSQALGAFLKTQLAEFMLPSAYVFLDTLPLLPSGKLDRKGLPAPESTATTAVEYSAPTGQVEATLAGIWAEVLGVERVGSEDNFFELGGDSILSIQVVSRASRVGLQLTPKLLFEHPTITQLAPQVGAAVAVQAEQGAVTGEVLLTPIQHWFFEQAFAHPSHWNQALLLRTTVPAKVLMQAMAAWQAQHDVLRLRFHHTANGWRQDNAALDLAVPCSQVDLSGQHAEAAIAALTEQAPAYQAGLNLQEGPLWQAVHFDLGEAGQRLLLVIHHLAVDGISWRILLEDLEKACQQGMAAQPIALGSKTTSFQQWSQSLSDYVQAGGCEGELEYWRTLAEQPLGVLPIDFMHGENTVGSTRRLRFSLSQAQTQQLLKEAGRAYHTEINDLLLTAVVRAIGAWSGSSAVWIDLEGHGREELFAGVDVSRTVGWFTSLFPVCFDLPDEAPLNAAIRLVKEQLRAIPHHGIGYGLLQKLSADTEVIDALADMPQPHIAFNYLGQLDSALSEGAQFSPATEDAGLDVAAANGRTHLLVVNAQVSGGQLHIDWAYSEGIHRKDNIEGLASACHKELIAILAHCLAPESGGYSPSDFPLAALDQARLDRLLGSGRSVEALYPLAPLQEGMLFHSLYEPSEAYFEQLHCELSGELRLSVFQEALQRVTARHPILRTALCWEGLDRPLQKVLRTVDIPLEHHDWRAVPPTELDVRWAAFLKADRQRGFDLSQVPLLRLSWVTLPAKQYRFVWSHHHVLLDGWSMSLVLGEVFRSYAALLKNEIPSLPPAGRYLDFIAWLAARDQGTAERYWRDYLAGIEAPTPLVLGEHLVSTETGQEEDLVISASDTEQLQNFVRTHQLTMNTVVQGAWALLLSRYCGERDILFGTTVSGRPPELPQVEQTLGMFINTVPLRANIPDEVTLVAWLATLQTQQVERQAFESSSLTQIQAWSDIPQGQPLFESILVFENYPVDAALAGQDLPFKVGRVEVFEQTNFPLTLIVQPGEQLALRLAYDPTRFSQATIVRMLGHLATMLCAMPANAEASLGELPVLTEPERQQLLQHWTDTQTEYPLLSIHELFEQQVERSPDTIAVVFGERQLSYRELDERANALAHHLRGLGVGPKIMVGISVARSLEMIVGLLGILKAGGAYVPLDPDYPRERLNYMLKDTEVPVILALEGLGDALPPHQAHVVYLDSEWQHIAANSPKSPEAGVKYRYRAYVMYTSGSTGKPKGIEVEHHNVVRLVKNTNYLEFGPEQVFLQFGPVAFDASTLEIWGPLLNGGRLVLAPPGQLSLEELGAIFTRHQITTVWLTAGLFHHLVEYHLDALRPLRQVLAGGDVLSPGHCKRVLAEIPGLVLINGYGPTENTTFTCCHAMHGVDDVGESVPIGRPIANTTVYILDRHGQPVPIGAYGELYTGGDGVARGYLNRPELTEQAFLADPFSAQPKARMYRTGDLARFRADGVLEFLGRIDHQVKVRGFRIELGEIEAVLSSCEGVRQNAVLVREDNPGDKRIVAYLVADPEQAPSTEHLRHFMQDRLPPYMLPSAYVTLESLPLNPNGKLDRKALPAPEIRLQEDDYVAPRTPTEEVLSEIWAQLLGVERIGIHDNFFELGGHSLLATRVASQMRETLKVDMPLRVLFEHPTVAGLAGQVGAVQHSVSTAGLALVPVARDQDLPLSFAQQRLWFLDQLESGSAFYNIPVVLQVSGRFEPEVLRPAMQTLVTRHEALRTTFSAQSGTPRQVIHPAGHCMLATIDLSEQEGVVQQTEAQRLILQEAQRPFDLAHGPLLRTMLLRLGEQEHILLLTLHHIIADGWSLGVLVHELTSLYAAYAQGKPNPLPELPIQYADFAHWQRQWLRDEVLEAQLAYWQEQLGGVAVLELPTDRPRPPVQSYRGARLPITLPPDVASDLLALSQKQGSTLFMTLLTAFNVLMHRYTGQSDFCVGSPVANRTRMELEPLIGFFVNTLALRADMAAEAGTEPSFLTLLARVRETTLAAYGHQDAPFERLVEALGLARDLSHTPLFQVMFALQNAPMEPVELADLAITPLPVDNATSKFDLNLDLSEQADGYLRGTLEYNTDLFDEATMLRMLEHFQNLLEAIVEDPSCPVSQLALIGDEELHTLLSEYNDTEHEYPSGACLHHLFEEQVALSPKVSAVQWGEQSLSYAELNARANQLAHYLREQGVGPDILVGICVTRSLDMAVAVLATLKAGGAYVPLDPEYPSDRLAYMLTHSEAPVVLTQSSLSAALPETTAKTILLDSEWSQIASSPDSNPRLALTSRNLAYVLYTSGSTGKPKGVAMPHQPLVNLIAWHNRRSRLKEGEKTLQFASFSFDMSFHEMFVSWTTGATLVLMEEELRLDMAALFDFIEAQQIARIHLPFVALQHLAEEIKQRDQAPKSLYKVLSTAEQLHITPAIVRMFQLLNNAELDNHYGPTETHVVTAVLFQGDPTTWPTVPSVGKPIANTQAYLLDDKRQPVPTGVPGELYFAGVALARGYLHRPELTVERFFDIDLPDGRTERVYRTGDLARWLPNGELECLGRADVQLKIRGFRVEPGEIEALLSEHEQVKDAVVILREDRPGQQRLVAYYLAQGDEIADPESLAAILKANLPSYMHPADYVHMPQFPLTPSGKVDRKALPAPEGRGENNYVAPRSAVEAGLAGIWTEVLGTAERIGAHDDFFQLGGHSLLATQVISRIRESFQVELPLRALFEAPSIAELASRVEQAQGEDGLPVAPPIVPVVRGERPLLSFAQQRLWFLDQMEPGNVFYNMPLALRVHGEIDAEIFRRVLEEVVCRHESLRTRFASENSEPYQVIYIAPFWRLPIKDLSSLPAAEREAEATRLAQAETQVPFDLAQGPLLRTTLLRLDAEDHVLLISMHHIISDGWSLDVLIQEVATLYAAFREGKRSPLAPLPIQYADFAHWQRQWLQGEVLATQIDYWKKSLQGAPALLNLPTDRPRPEIQTLHGAHYSFTLPVTLAQDLQALCKEQGCTLFMALLATYQLLLSRYTGQQDVCVGIPIAGRNRTEIEGLIGFFINALVMRTDLSGNPNVAGLLARVREVTLGAYAHQDLPFEMLVDALQPERKLSYAPIAQVGFTLQNTPQGAVELPGVRLEPVETETGTAKYDFTLMLAEGPEGLLGTVEYNTDLFDRSTVERMVGHYQNLLEALLAKPDAQIDQLAVVPEAQCYDLLGLERDAFEAILPLTSMQRDLYLETRIHPDTRQNSLGYGVEINNGLDIDRWRRALQTLTDSQAILRSKIVAAPAKASYADVAYQCVLREYPVAFQFEDLSAQVPTEEELATRIRETIWCAYDPEQGPMSRHLLLKLGPTRYMAIFAVHHMILDGVAATQHLLEICTLYEGLSEEEDEAAPPAYIYPEYIHWHRERFDTEPVFDFWHKQFQGVEALDFPLEAKVEEVQTLCQTLDDEHWRKLRSYCRRQRITPAIYFRCLYSLLLKQYCRATGDFFIQEFVAGRPKGHAASFGCYYQQIPFIFRQEVMGGENTIAELFGYARDYQKGLGDKQYLSIFQQNRLVPQARLHFLFNFYHFAASIEFLGVEESILQFSPPVARGQVQFIVKVIDGTLQLNLHYYPGEFRDLGLLDRLQSLSQQLIEGKVEKLAALQYLSEEEANCQQQQWNPAATELPAYNTVAAMIEAQVQRTPDAPALRLGEQVWSYQEINCRANQLAHHLWAQGVGRESRVGLCTERSLEMIVGVLGIIKSGAAYIPMDAAYPRERLAYMLSDAAVPVLLTQAHLLARLPTHDGQTLCLDKDWDTLAKQSQDNPDSGGVAQDLLYVVYTSGSTGRPKGAGVSHAGELNLLHWYTQEFGMGPYDRLLLMSAFGFDLTQKNLFAPLTVGATLVLPEREEYDDRYLREQIAKHDITWLNCAPSAFYPLLAGEQNEALNTLQHVFLGGEAIVLSKLEGWMAQTECQIVNSYGPTECTDIAAYHRLGQPSDYPDGIIPIGRPNYNVQLHILNEQGQRLPTGVAGELCIGGYGVGLGYMNDEQKTAEQFIPDPEGGEGARLYRTGDLVAYRADGELIYIGRKDFQVKLRGLRIELGEIEYALEQQKGVKDSLVMVHEDNLIAYLIGAEQDIDTTQLRSQLGEYLPNYMIPAGYVVLAKWPLTPNGKVDRKALPLPQAATEYVAPRNPIEEALVELWQQVLGVDRVGVQDDFFALGGHSLLLVQLVNRIKEVLQQEISMTILFQYPTIAELAALFADPSAISAQAQHVDLEKEAILAPEICATGEVAAVTAPKNIFLTGATGFVGAFLVQELLTHTEANIHCLVRAKDEQAGRQRLQDNLRRYELWDESQQDRVIAVLGNLSDPYLGIGGEAFQQLSETVDLIYHNGASVSYSTPYAVSKIPNVGGTHEVLRMASQHHVKPVHMMSTLSVYTDSPVTVTEDTPIEDQIHSSLSGYAASKWVAEQLAHIARERGIPVSIYRPGHVTGHSQTGMCNPDDFFHRMIRGCATVGYMPTEVVGHDTDLTPVDYIVHAMVLLSLAPECVGRNYNLLSPHGIPYREMLGHLKAHNKAPKDMPVPEWVDRVIAFDQENPSSAFHEIMGLVQDWKIAVDEQQKQAELDIQQDGEKGHEEFGFDTAATVAALSHWDWACPPPDEVLLGVYFGFLEKRGLL